MSIQNKSVERILAGVGGGGHPLIETDAELRTITGEKPRDLAGRYMEFVRHYFNDISNQTACIKNEIIYDAEINVPPLFQIFKDAVNAHSPDRLYYFNANHLGSGSLITDKNGDTYQTLIYAPHGEVLYNKFYGDYDEPYKFNGKELDSETGFYNFNARQQDPIKDIWTSTDPMWYKYPNKSPYVAMGNNPILYIDTDGKEVIAVDVAARQAILNTLPKDIRGQVQFDNTGRIDKNSFNQINTSSGNFGALSQLVNDTKVFEFNVTDNITYKDENGNLINTSMGNIEKTDDYDGSFGMNTGEMGWLGVTQTPGDAPNKYNSPDDVVRITVNSGLSPEGQAQMVSHEGYGHAYLYSKGELHTHQAQGMKETNSKLAESIINAIKETIKNMKE